MGRKNSVRLVVRFFISGSENIRLGALSCQVLEMNGGLNCQLLPQDTGALCGSVLHVESCDWSSVFYRLTSMTDRKTA